MDFFEWRPELSSSTHISSYKKGVVSTSFGRDQFHPVIELAQYETVQKVWKGYEHVCLAQHLDLAYFIKFTTQSSTRMGSAPDK